jgi:hypothetical protein
MIACLTGPATICEIGTLNGCPCVRGDCSTSQTAYFDRVRSI